MRLLSAKAKIVAAIASHSNTMSIKPRPGERAPKNRNDHAKFNSSCAPNSRQRPLALHPPSTPARPPPPSSCRAAVHTGPKSHEGGVHDGLLRVGYHSNTDLHGHPATQRPPPQGKAPRNRQAPTKSASDIPHIIELSTPAKPRTTSRPEPAMPKPTPNAQS